MEIVIRNISAATAKTLSQKAAKAGLSRQAFLQGYLERLAAVDAYRDEREEYSTLVKNMGVVIGNNTDQMQRVENLLEDILDKLEEGK